jgi:arginyl-tRNA synthetase
MKLDLEDFTYINGHKFVLREDRIQMAKDIQEAASMMSREEVTDEEAEELLASYYQKMLLAIGKWDTDSDEVHDIEFYKSASFEDGKVEKLIEYIKKKFNRT